MHCGILDLSSFVWLGDIYTRQNGFIEFHQKAVRVNMPGGELSRILVLRMKCKARSKRRSTHVPNLTDELSTAEDRRLNQFGSAG